MENINTKNTTNEANDEVGNNDDDETESRVNHLVFGFFNSCFFVSGSNPLEPTKNEVDSKGETGHDRKRGDDNGNILVEDGTGVRGEVPCLLIFADTRDGISERYIGSENRFD